MLPGKMFGLLTVVGTVAMIGLAIWGVRYMDQRKCEAVSKGGVEARYQGIIEGCFVKVQDRFIPLENWRGEYER